MQIDTSIVIKNLKGEDMKDQDGETLTIGHVIITALNSGVPGDQNIDFEEKAKLFKLAVRATQPVASFSTKEAGQIMDRVGKAWPPLVCGRLQEAFEPAEAHAPAKPNGAASEAPGLQ